MRSRESNREIGAAPGSLHRKTNPCGLVESFLIFFAWIGIGDDAGIDLIDELVVVADERADGAAI